MFSALYRRAPSWAIEFARDVNELDSCGVTDERKQDAVSRSKRVEDPFRMSCHAV